MILVRLLRTTATTTITHPTVAQQKYINNTNGRFALVVVAMITIGFVLADLCM